MFGEWSLGFMGLDWKKGKRERLEREGETDAENGK